MEQQQGCEKQGTANAFSCGITVQDIMDHTGATPMMMGRRTSHDTAETEPHENRNMTMYTTCTPSCSARPPQQRRMIITHRAGHYGVAAATGTLMRANNETSTMDAATRKHSAICVVICTVSAMVSEEDAPRGDPPLVTCRAL